MDRDRELSSLAAMLSERLPERPLLGLMAILRATDPTERGKLERELGWLYEGRLRAGEYR